VAPAGAPGARSEASTTGWAGDRTRAGDDETRAAGSTRLAIGAIIGGLAFDPGLDDYRWDVSPTMQSGAQATLYWKWLAAGARVWRAHTTQASGIPGESQAPRVNLTGIELTAGARALSIRGVELWGSAHAGRLLLGYDPDQLTFDSGGIGEPITVAYQPIDEWDVGAGIELRREIARQMSLALETTVTSFALDTAHRRGNEIVEARERFYAWNLRFEVAWLVDLD